VITLYFYEVPARDYQAQRKYNIANQIPYRRRYTDWYVYRDPKRVHHWQSWEDDVGLQSSDDLVREARNRRWTR
jgi:hypothetical protein